MHTGHFPSGSGCGSPQRKYHKRYYRGTERYYRLGAIKLPKKNTWMQVRPALPKLLQMDSDLDELEHDRKLRIRAVKTRREIFRRGKRDMPMK